MAAPRQRVQSFGDDLLRVPEVPEKDAASLTDGVGDHRVVLEFLVQGLMKNGGGYL